MSKHFSASRWTKRSSQCRPNSTTTSAERPRTRAALPGSRQRGRAELREMQGPLFQAQGRGDLLVHVRVRVPEKRAVTLARREASQSGGQLAKRGRWTSMTMRGSTIGPNRDLKSIRQSLDCHIRELKQLAGGTSDRVWISARLTALGRERIAVSAILADRRIEAGQKVVVFSRWLTGNGVISGTRCEHEYVQPLARKRSQWTMIL